jgi:hypothetical protein
MIEKVVYKLFESCVREVVARHFLLTVKMQRQIPPFFLYPLKVTPLPWAAKDQPVRPYRLKPVDF